MKQKTFCGFLCLVFSLFKLTNVYGLIPVTVTNPGNTTPALSATYTSLANALAALNATTAMTGPVILTCTAGGSETAPPTGLSIGSVTLNPVLSAAHTVTINKSGGVVTLNAGVGTANPASAAPDGVLNLNGADFITIDGLTITDGNLTNPESMEYGIGIFKRNLSDGANNNTIKNCTINMQRVNNATGTSPMTHGSTGIIVMNSTPTAATTALTPTTAAGSSSNNKIYSNTINNGNNGIYLIGYAAPTSPYTPADFNNDIGGTLISTGNTILNFGGGGASNQSVGILISNQWSINISNNTINNNDGAGINHANTLKGISGSGGINADATIGSNTISIKGGGTTAQMLAIDNSIGQTGTTNTVNIINNTIANCSYSSSTTGKFQVIQNTTNPFNLNIIGNTIKNNSLAGTSQSAIIHPATEKNLVIQNNEITNFTRTGSAGVESAIDILDPTTSALIEGNLIDNVSWSSGTTAVTFGIYSLSNATNVTITDNTIRNLVSATTCTGIYETGAAGTKNISNNEIYNFSANSNTGSVGVVFKGIEVEIGTCNINNNSIYSLGNSFVSGGISSIVGIMINASVTSSTTTNNRICDLSITSSGNIYGIYALIGNNVISNNRISDLRYINSGTNSEVFGIYILGGSASACYFNSVFLNIIPTTSNRTAALFAVTSVGLTLNNNILVNTSTTGGGLVAALRFSSTTLSNYNSSSNRNCLFAPVLFYDGTNSKNSLGPGPGTYKNLVSPRDANSISENPPFLSSICGNSNFLKINTAVMTDVESGGANVGGIAQDFEGNPRHGNVGYSGSGIAPDIGADEFNGIYFPKCSGTPAANTINGSSPICQNSETALALNVQYTETGYAYQWKSGNTPGGPYPNNLDVTTTQLTGNLSAATYFVCTITCQNSGLSFTTPEKPVLINPAPPVNVNPTSAVYCNPGPALFLAATGALTYTWTPSTGLNATTGTPVGAQPIVNTTYTVTGTDGIGCTASANAVITVKAAPQFATANSNPSSICSNSTSNLSSIGYILPAVVNYLFSAGTGASLDPMSGATTLINSPAVSGGSGDNTPSTVQNIGFNFVLNSVSYSQFSVSPDGWIMLGGITAIAQSTNSANSNTNIPKIYPLWDDICVGSDGNVKVLLTGSFPNRILKIQWFVTIPKIIGGAANSTYQVWLYENSNIEFRYGTVGNPPSASAGVTNSATNFSSITYSSNTAAPNSANNSNSTSPPSGTIYTYVPSSIVLNYSWSPAGLVVSPNSQNTSTNMLSNTTTFTVTVDNAGCLATASTVVNADPLSCSSATVSSPICAGSNFTVSANKTGGVAPYHYSWSDGVGGSYGDIQTITANKTAGNYTFTCTVTDACGSCISSINVVVNPIPNVQVNPATSLICIPGGSSVTLTASNASTYSWSPTSGLSPTTGSVVSALPGSTTTYTVTGTLNGCSATASTIVTVASKPNVGSTVSPTSTVCNGTAVTLNGTGASTYSWNNGVTNGVAFTPSVTTTYTVTGTAVNTCTSSSTRIITVNPKPTVSFTANPSQVICSGSPLTLSGTGANSYTWTGGITNGVSFIPPSTTTYTVTGTDINNCTNTAPAPITVNPLPTVTYTISPSANVCPGNSVTLNGTGANSYSWTGGISNGIAFSPSVTTTYTVTGTDNNGCTKTSSAIIIVDIPIFLTAVSSVPATCVGSSVELSTVLFPQSPYCQPVTNCSSHMISNVTIDGVSRNSACDGSLSGGYSFQPFPNRTLVSGNSYPLSVTTTGGNLGAAGWIDWDQDGTFAAGEQIFSAFFGTNPATYNSNINVPSTALNGTTRMRIRGVLNLNPNSLASPPCSNASNGETEDYSVTVVNGQSNGYAFSWQPTTFLSNPTIYNPTISSLGFTTTYTVTATSQMGCTSNSTIIVSANEPNDNNICTDDFCDPANGNITHTAVNVNDNNPCTTDFCDTGSGIHHDAVANGSPGQPDAFVCTEDVCQSGNTIHTAVNVNDNNACTNDGCNEPGGVFHTNVNVDDGNSCTQDACNTSTGAITHTNTCSVTLNLKLYLEGYYSGSGIMENATSAPFGGCLFHTGLSPNPQDADIVTVHLMNASPPFTLVENKIGFLKTNGDVQVVFVAVNPGTAYYIKVTQRNCIETWSAAPVMMFLTTSYFFNTSISQAYGNNMADLGDGNFAFFSGDISDASLGLSNQDGVVESQDYGDMENAVSVTRLGYTTEDITGDGIVESSDYGLMENNVFFTRVSIRP